MDAELKFPRGIYGITPENCSSAELIQHVEAACRGGMRALQWRRKHLYRREHLAQAPLIRNICRRHHCLFVVNDSLELALELDADGVHLGKDDEAVESALERLQRQSKKNFILGVSCYNQLALGAAMMERGADYIAFGALFPSPTKPQALRADLSLLTEAVKLRAQRFGGGPKPAIVAIGGIQAENARAVFQAGADSVAVISGLFGPPADAAATARNINALHHAAGG